MTAVRELFFQPMYDRLHRLVFENSPMKAVAALLSGYVATFVTDNLDAFLALMLLVAWDQVTGVILAVKQRRLSSRHFRRGLVKAFVYTSWVWAFFLIERIEPFFSKLHLDMFSIIYLSITELLSILENLQQLSTVKLPGWIEEALKRLKKDRGE